MRRFLIFIGVVALGIFTPAYLYLGFRLAYGLPQWLLLAVPFLIVLSLPLTLLRHRDSDSTFSRIWSQLIFFSMGLLTYIVVFTVLRDAIWLLLRMSRPLDAAEWTNRFLQTRTVLALSGVALALGVFRATRGPTLRNVKIESDSIPPELGGFRIVQISDLHIGETIGRRYVERVVEMANGAKPDLIALTGDLGDGSVRNAQEALKALAGLSAKYGIFYVTGNHEYYWNAGEWMGAMNGIGANVLSNREMSIDVGEAKISVAGIPDPQASATGKFQGPDLSALGPRPPDTKFRILLSHRPGFAKEASRLGFDLQLSGHTHGGQFFPWTIVVRLVHEFSLGLYKAGKMSVYVSGGTGSWGPLIRLGTTPELTVLHLVSPGPSRN